MKKEIPTPNKVLEYVGKFSAIISLIFLGLYASDGKAWNLVSSNSYLFLLIIGFIIFPLTLISIIHLLIEQDNSVKGNKYFELIGRLIGLSAMFKVFIVIISLLFGDYNQKALFDTIVDSAGWMLIISLGITILATVYNLIKRITKTQDGKS